MRLIFLTLNIFLFSSAQADKFKIVKNGKQYTCKSDKKKTKPNLNYTCDDLLVLDTITRRDAYGCTGEFREACIAIVQQKCTYDVSGNTFFREVEEKTGCGRFTFDCN